MVKSKKVIFRVSEEMFSFLQEFSQSVRMERSELMRKIVEHYFLMYFSDSNTDTYEELKGRFLNIPSVPEQDVVAQSESKNETQGIKTSKDFYREHE